MAWERHPTMAWERHAAALAAVMLMLAAASEAATTVSQNVLQHHKEATRSGFYIWSGLAKANVARTTQVSKITMPLNGQVYAQVGDEATLQNIAPNCIVQPVAPGTIRICQWICSRPCNIYRAAWAA